MTDDPASKGRASARSRLVGPLIGSTHRVLRALDLWSDGPGGYDARTIALLEMYAAAAVATIERARLQAEMQERRRFDSDLALARTVMVDLLPNVAPTLNGFDIAGAHETSIVVGGDYYEFIPLGEDRWGVIISYLVGKGIAAALLVAVT